MAQVTGFTAQRMLEIENNTVVAGSIVGDDLILTTYGGDNINAGNVRGPIGPEGPVGEVSQAELDAALDALVLGVDGIADGSITAVKLAPNSVETAKIADGAVTGSKIPVNTINNGHLAANSVDSGQYVDGSIDPEHLANNAVTGAAIANDAVDSRHIASGAIDPEHFAIGSVQNAALGSSAVTSAKLATNSVTSEKIATKAVTNTKLDDTCVTQDKVAVNAISESRLFNEHGSAYLGSNYTVTTTPAVALQTPVSCGAGSIIIATLTADLTWLDPSAEDYADLVQVEFRVDGSLVDGAMIARPYRVNNLAPTRFTMSKTWIYVPSAALVNDNLQMRIFKASNINNVTLTGGVASSASHTRIDYFIIKN